MDWFGWWWLPFTMLIAVPHELGHAVAARWVGVQVVELGFGVPPHALTVRWRSVRWTLNWLPLGAFVRLADITVRPPQQRLLVTLAGPFANVLVGMLAWFALLALPSHLLRDSLLDIQIGSFLMLLTVGSGVQAVLNLLPIPPMDGVRVFGALRDL